MKKTTFWLLALSLILSTAAQAQEAPAPRRMPRVPVSREVVVEPHDAMPATRELQGPAAVIDGEKLRIGETDIRLFGVVPPQLSASFGPQARAALDSLANGQSVSCQVRDRDRDGRLLATCHNASGNDMALELLKRGLAVTARGSLAGTEVAATYAAAEQAAQNQKVGLWSIVSAAPVTVPVAVATPQPKQESSAPPATVEEPKKEEKITPHADAQTQARIAADVVAQQSQARLDDTVWTPNEEVGFFERYQILIACFLMLITATGIMGSLWAQKSRDRREETRAAAAALRGELMAARSVCFGRAKSIIDDEAERAATWPRIRATLYQAYVGRLGLLGAELARQIAAIYGQSSDYAAHYNTAGIAHDLPKKQALETLTRRIDEVLPKLAEIERTGSLPHFLPTPPTSRLTFHVPKPSTVSSPPLLTPPVTPQPEAEAVEPVAPAQPAVPPTPSQQAYTQATMLRPTTALWEAVRNFIQSHRAHLAPPPHPLPEDPHVAEYAAMIEADMERYHLGEPNEPLDIMPQKKQG